MSEIEQVLMNEIQTNKSPSVQYYIFNEERIIKSFHSGFANIAKRQQVDVDTTYNAFSVTKTFTALAILQLAEQRKIELDKSIIYSNN